MAEYVCADGRMSVNGACSVINQNVGNSDVNNNITKNYSKDVKSNFRWDFDKVGDKVGNFNDILTNSLNSFDTYVAENVTLEKKFQKKKSNNFRKSAENIILENL